jgi:hypothetical protein
VIHKEHVKHLEIPVENVLRNHPEMEQYTGERNDDVFLLMDI